MIDISMIAFILRCIILIRDLLQWGTNEVTLEWRWAEYRPQAKSSPHSNFVQPAVGPLSLPGGVGACHHVPAHSSPWDACTPAAAPSPVNSAWSEVERGSAGAATAAGAPVRALFPGPEPGPGALDTAPHPAMYSLPGDRPPERCS